MYTMVLAVMNFGLSNMPWEGSVPCESENFTWEMYVESFVKFPLISFSHRDDTVAWEEMLVPHVRNYPLKGREITSGSFHFPCEISISSLWEWTNACEIFVTLAKCLTMNKIALNIQD